MDRDPTAGERDRDLIALYWELAADEEREREALEWIEAAVDDGLD